MKRPKRRALQKPYAMLGAGRLASALWKAGDERCGWRYRFNVYRMSGRSGEVCQLLRPGDVLDLVKLAQVLAAVLVDDGCVSGRERRVLGDLAARLEAINHARA